MRVILNVTDTRVRPDPAVRAWIDAVAERLNTEKRVSERGQLVADLLCHGHAITMGGRRIDPAELVNLPRDSTPD